MDRLLLALAILLEVSGTTCMKLSVGFTRPLPTVLVLLFYVGSFTALSITLKTLPVSVVYAIWSGVGTVLVAAVGMIWFKESLTALKVVSIALIVAGVVGLNLSLGGR
ncbi:MAG TPA: multidrug efflux SMR transporter [Candidatus Deferrimicrobiaceae bacterium]